MTLAGLYEGEQYDARREPPGWSPPASTIGDWAPVEVVEFDRPALVAPTGPPVRGIAALDPVAVRARARAGGLMVDFGQNLVGRLRIRASRPGRPDDHPAACRGARGRRARRPRRCAAAAPPTSTPCAADGVPEVVGAAVHLPRLPLRRDRGLARRARAGDVAGGRRATPTCAAPAGSTAPTRW